LSLPTESPVVRQLSASATPISPSFSAAARRLSCRDVDGSIAAAFGVSRRGRAYHSSDGTSADRRHGRSLVVDFPTTLTARRVADGMDGRAILKKQLSATLILSAFRLSIPAACHAVMAYAVLLNARDLNARDYASLRVDGIPYARRTFDAEHKADCVEWRNSTRGCGVRTALICALPETSRTIMTILVSEYIVLPVSH
jgi:hypothetical protein